MGMTPDQLLPDFASFTSGTAFFDATFTFLEFTVDVTLQAVEIVLISDPEPSVPTMRIGSRVLLILLIFAAGVILTNVIDGHPDIAREHLRRVIELSDSLAATATEDEVLAEKDAARLPALGYLE
jgi:hypothetical protein